MARNTRSIDYTGMGFGRVTITRKDKDRRWFGLCSCGSPEKSFLIANLVNGTTESCGCGRMTHCLSKKQKASYNVWFNMIDRCHNSRHPYFHRYGGRGISVDPRWVKFENFFEDMGPQPAGYTLERKKNNLGYSKENCTWDTRKAQANNRSSNRLLTLDGETMNVKQWANHLPQLQGKDYVVCKLLAAGWSVEKALRTPVRAKRH